MLIRRMLRNVITYTDKLLYLLSFPTSKELRVITQENPHPDDGQKNSPNVTFQFQEIILDDGTIIWNLKFEAEQFPDFIHIEPFDSPAIFKSKLPTGQLPNHGEDAVVLVTDEAIRAKQDALLDELRIR